MPVANLCCLDCSDEFRIYNFERITGRDWNQYASAPEEMSQQPLRVTQRKPLACHPCTQRKVKCDKALPCSGCQRRGLDCWREDVVVAKKRKASPRNDDALSSGRPRLSLSPRQDQAAGESQAQLELGDLTTADPAPTFRRSDQDVGPRPSRPSVALQFEDLPTAIEGLAWGRHQCHSYPHADCQLSRRFSTLGPTQPTSEVLDRLPRTAVARDLVHFHVEYLCWYHNVLHMPTFLDQCERFWSTGVIDHPQWVSVYAAVLSASSWTIANEPSFSGQTASGLPDVLFELAVEQLFANGFMEKHSICSTQAVSILGMVANALDRSDLFVTIVNAANRIAQCLGLHRIPDSTPDETADVALEREVGRRVWWKLVELDYHSMPYTGTLSINPQSFSTRLPINCQDRDLVQVDDTILTTSTFNIIMSKVARLMPSVLDGMSSTGADEQRYAHVIDTDRRMRQLVTTLPAVILRRQQHQAELQTPWLATARRTLSIAVADKIIMIHRPFMLKSFRSPFYHFTRSTCVSAAMTILREHEEISMAGSDCVPIWVHSAFCVTAVVVLCLNVLHSRTRVGADTANQDAQVALVLKARSRLTNQRYDKMANRGIHLIDAMLSSGGNRPREGGLEHDSVDADQIIARFMALEGEEDKVKERQTEPASSPPSEVTGGLGDFENWFNATFAS